jgi:hypothetical protein
VKNAPNPSFELTATGKPVSAVYVKHGITRNSPIKKLAILTAKLAKMEGGKGYRYRPVGGPIHR